MSLLSNRRSVLALAIGGIVFSTVACDKMQSDARQADLRVQAAVKAGAAGRRAATTQGLNTAVSELTKAVSENAASPVQKIQARSLLAQTEFEAGERFVRDINPHDVAVNRALWDVHQAASAIAAANRSAEALNKSNPEAALKVIADKRAEMAGVAEAAAKKAGELQAEIDKIKGQIAELTKQREAAIASADADAEKANKLSLKDASPILDGVIENRRKAGNWGHDIEKLTASLLPFERDAAVELGKKKNADEGVAALDADKKVVEDNWAEAQKQIAGQKTLLTKLGADLATSAKNLDDAVKASNDLRAKAIEQFTKAAGHYKDSAGVASTLFADMGKLINESPKAPEAKAWDGLRKTYSNTSFKLLEAQAHTALGNVYNRQREEIANRARLVAAITPVLQAAGLTPPAELGATLDADLQKAKKAADDHYTEAAAGFLGVYGVGTNPKDINESARVSRMFSLYEQFLASEPRDTAKLNEAKKEFGEAYGDKKDDPMLRNFPAELKG